jgi:hypothetical protein
MVHSGADASSTAGASPRRVRTGCVPTGPLRKHEDVANVLCAAVDAVHERG